MSMNLNAVKPNDHVIVRFGTHGTQIAVFKRWVNGATAQVIKWRKNSRTWTNGEVRLPAGLILRFATPRELQAARCPCGFACTHGYKERRETSNA